MIALINIQYFTFGTDQLKSAVVLQVVHFKNFSIM